MMLGDLVPPRAAVVEKSFASLSELLVHFDVHDDHW